jgi:hypothetical protein
VLTCNTRDQYRASIPIHFFSASAYKKTIDAVGARQNMRQNLLRRHRRKILSANAGIICGAKHFIVVVIIMDSISLHLLHKGAELAPGPAARLQCTV